MSLFYNSTMSLYYHIAMFMYYYNLRLQSKETSSDGGPLGYLMKPIFSGLFLLKGSWDLVSRVMSISIEVISNYNCSYLAYNPNY